MSYAHDLPDLMRRVVARDPSAAPDLEALADRLRALAADLRAGDPAGGIASPGGMADRVRMDLIGPGGELKHSIDTGAQR